MPTTHAEATKAAVLAPPWPRDGAGNLRTVGVEIELGGLSPEEAARALQEQLGGTVLRESEFQAVLQDSALGTVECELDTRYAEKTAGESEIGSVIRTSLVELAENLIPTELTFEPVPWSRLEEFGAVTDVLRQAGAEGTRQNPLYAFGTHLNVAVPMRDIAVILEIFRAYLRAEPDLRRRAHIDLSRRVLPFIDNFPSTFREMVLSDSYHPDLQTFIRDYCTANPNKNRGLDLLPLLADLDRDAVERALGEPPKAVRPTFHYRLPNADLDDPAWSVVVEWNRWVEIEAAAARALSIDPAGGEPTAAEDHPSEAEQPRRRPDGNSPETTSAEPAPSGSPAKP